MKIFGAYVMKIFCPPPLLQIFPPSFLKKIPTNLHKSLSLPPFYIVFLVMSSHENTPITPDQFAVNVLGGFPPQNPNYRKIHIFYRGPTETWQIVLDARQFSIMMSFITFKQAKWGAVGYPYLFLNNDKYGDNEVWYYTDVLRSNVVATPITQIAEYLKRRVPSFTDRLTYHRPPLVRTICAIKECGYMQDVDLRLDLSPTQAPSRLEQDVIELVSPTPIPA